MKARTIAALAVAFIGAATVLAPVAHANPTVWTRVRSPDIARRKELLAQAEALIRKRDGEQSTSADVVGGVAELYLREAQRKLEEAGGASSPDYQVRLRYATVLEDLNDAPGCVRALTPFIKSSAPPLVLAEAFSTLAVCHAKLSHHEEEMQFYERALEVEANGRRRAVLFANRAEALMALGDLPSALSGYREAISLEPTSSTSYWGLAVALDRSGNLEGAMEALRIARAYDKNDAGVGDRAHWFFSPRWDEPWYFALGHWQAARASTLTAARTEHYLAAVALWEEYLERAPADAQYVPLARVRLKECERERDRVLKRHPQSTHAPKKSPAEGVSPTAPPPPRPPPPRF